jgi:hypothetical protein
VPVLAGRRRIARTGGVIRSSTRGPKKRVRPLRIFVYLDANVVLPGRWAKDEEGQLMEIVKDLTIDQGKDADHEVFWTVVAELMGHARSRQQCRNKWYRFFFLKFYSCVLFIIRIGRIT